jgi:hypothetical protein
MRASPSSATAHCSAKWRRARLQRGREAAGSACEAAGRVHASWRAACPGAAAPDTPGTCPSPCTGARPARCASAALDAAAVAPPGAIRLQGDRSAGSACVCVCARERTFSEKALRPKLCRDGGRLDFAVPLLLAPRRTRIGSPSALVSALFARPAHAARPAPRQRATRRGGAARSAYKRRGAAGAAGARRVRAAGWRARTRVRRCIICAMHAEAHVSDRRDAAVRGRGAGADATARQADEEACPVTGPRQPSELAAPSCGGHGPARAAPTIRS